MPGQRRGAPGQCWGARAALGRPGSVGAPGQRWCARAALGRPGSVWAPGQRWGARAALGPSGRDCIFGINRVAVARRRSVTTSARPAPVTPGEEEQNRTGQDRTEQNRPGHFDLRVQHDTRRAGRPGRAGRPSRTGPAGPAGLAHAMGALAPGIPYPVWDVFF
eukprot:gene14789-biopygen20132